VATGDGLQRVVFFAMSRAMAGFININKFSLHDMYRNRLIRAYLGASIPKGPPARLRDSRRMTTWGCTT